MRGKVMNIFPAQKSTLAKTMEHENMTMLSGLYPLAGG